MAVLNGKWLPIFCVVTTYLSMALLGLIANIFGPSLVYLEVLLDTNTETIGFALLGFAIGYAISALLCGVIYEWFNPELQLCVSVLFMGAATVLLPWLPNVYAFIAGVSIQAVFVGYFEPASNAYVIRQCGDHRVKRPALTGLHALWSIGAAIGPLVLRPFLVDLPKHDIASEYVIANRSTFENMTANLSVTAMNSTDETTPGVELIRYGYMVVGVACIVPFFLYLVLLIKKGAKLRSDAKPQKTQPSETKDVPRVPIQKIAFIALILVIFFVQEVYGASLPRGFLSAFTVKALGWPAQKGALIMTVFWLIHGASRVIGVILSTFLSPTKITFMNLVFAFSGYFLMIFTPTLSVSMMWLAAFLTAFGAGTTFPMLMLFLSDYISITGRVTAAIFLTLSVNLGCSGVVMGYLIQNYSPNTFPKVAIFAVVLHLILFLLAIFVGKKVGKKKTHTKDKSEIEQDDKGKALEEKEPLESKGSEKV